MPSSIDKSRKRASEKAVPRRGTREKGSRLLRLSRFENRGSEGAIKPDAPVFLGGVQGLWRWVRSIVVILVGYIAPLAAFLAFSGLILAGLAGSWERHVKPSQALFFFFQGSKGIRFEICGKKGLWLQLPK